MIISKTIKIPIYGVKWTIEFVDSISDIEKKYGITDTESNTAIFLSKGSRYATIYEKSYLTPGIIAHECKHLVNKLFYNLGVDLDHMNDEAECYLLNWLVDKVDEIRENNEIPYKLRKRSGSIRK